MKSLSAFLILSTLVTTAFGGVVTGTATYRERIVLPSGAVFEASLEDVSKAGAAAEVLGKARLEPPGNPPFSFEIAYDEGRIKPSHRYAVRGRVLLKDRLMFTSDRQYPVLTQGAGKEVAILLRMASARQPTRPGKPEAGLAPPASFEGDLPCADCPGIRYHIDLFPDRVYYQRMDYLERNLAVDDIGNWVLSGDGKQLSLSQNNQVIDRFAIKDPATLRKLDGEGHELDSALNGELKRMASFQPIEPKLTLRGLYSHTAEAGVFIECQSRLRLPVAQEQDNADLESAYGKVRRSTAESILAEVEGRVVMRPKVDGAGEQPTLVVERFINLGQPGKSCGGPVPTAQLQETFWELTHLGNEPVKPQEKQSLPHIILHKDKQRVSGFGGCNNLSGTYVLEGEKLSFDKMASTLMACIPPAMELESSVNKMLEQVKVWKIEGERLELLDGDGKSLARFQSRYMRWRERFRNSCLTKQKGV